MVSVFTCIPASTAEKNETRYKAFSEKVCELTGAINAYDHIKVSGGDWQFMRTAKFLRRKSPKFKLSSLMKSSSKARTAFALTMY